MTVRTTMTDTRRHSRAPLRRSSTPERILSAGLATAACIGVVGLLGVRTIEANAASTESGTNVDLAVSPADATTASAATTSTGLTEAQLDAYAADLAREKERLDAYRAKLVKTANKLQRQADRQAATASSASSAGTTRAVTTAPAAPAAKPKPVAKPKPAVVKPAPAAKPAPKPAPAPAPKPAPQVQSNTKGS